MINSKIIKQEKNPFLEREEILLEIKNETTPTYDEVKSATGKDPNLTVIKKINTNFGDQIFIAEVQVYDNLKAKKRIETIPKKTRKKMEADEKAEREAKKKAEAEAKQKAEEEAKAKEAEQPQIEEIKSEEEIPEKS